MKSLRSFITFVLSVFICRPYALSRSLASGGGVGDVVWQRDGKCYICFEAGRAVSHVIFEMLLRWRSNWFKCYVACLMYDVLRRSLSLTFDTWCSAFEVLRCVKNCSTSYVSSLMFSGLGLKRCMLRLLFKGSACSVPRNGSCILHSTFSVH